MWTRETDDEQLPQHSPAPAVADTARPPEERRRVAWIGKSVLFRGDLISLEDMSIDGQVEGTIELRDHTLTIGQEATVHGDIVAKTVYVCGRVVGTISATDAVHIKETGSIEGKITSRTFAVADGAVVKGEVNTSAKRAAAPPVSPPQAKVTASAQAAHRR